MAFRLGSLLLAWVFCAPFCEAVRGAIPTFSGRTPCYWVGRSVVVAEITDLAFDDETRQYYVRFTPLLTLAGSFDCAAMGEQRVALAYGQFGSCLEKLPRPPQIAVVVLARSKEAYHIPGESSGYMPRGQPVWEVASLESKDFESIATAVHERRPESERNQVRERRDCSEVKQKYAGLDKATLRLLKADLSIPTVVYAEVVAITSENEMQRLKLRLLGTVAGKLDAALVHEVELTVTSKQLDGHALPKIGEKAFFALTSEKEGEYQLAADHDFMPSKWSIGASGEKPNDATSQCLRILESLESRFEKK